MGWDEDRKLFEDCLAGLPGGWDAFVARFSPYLAEVCRRALVRCGRPASRQDVEDLVQEVLMACLENQSRVLRDYRGRSAPTTYLGAVAVHCAYRKAGREIRTVPLERLAPVGLVDPGASEPSDAFDRLRRELAKLPSKASLALSLQCEGASIREVGRVLGVSEDAAAQILSRARSALREALAVGVHR